MKNLTILGSTGSIGVSTLDVVKAYPDMFRVVALTAGNNLELLKTQIETFSPDLVSVLTAEKAQALSRSLTGKKPEIMHGVEGMIAAATASETTMVVAAIVGAAGLVPTTAAIMAGKDVALANKETLVTAGHLVMQMVREKKVNLYPVDSEHCAVFQSMAGHRSQDIARVILTASGGPFLNWGREKLQAATVADALNHPNWSMGRKITVDSATMMNKGLEVIEARWLFDIPVQRIGVNIHPQSIIHSMVEYVDGSVMAQLGTPDMKGPIAYALTYPGRVPSGVKALDLTALSGLTFFKPDTDRFPALQLAYRAADAGESMPAVMNAANEIAVEAFLGGRIGFMAIAEAIEKVMDLHEPHALASIEEVLEADRWGRRTAKEVLGVGC
ncbi:1-deoxy-D-xylulose-5-phosphate reductoisomerase [Citrifermentans bemidjiense Bem]|uniref:1-deoxy-D-xylulose 5-phosphate reductoisomerase n=1 Tax=Citrifermentans bemidjiense (strain ATCC BAA-1014 / DSM 16622 / JCM 12645 / Bem) TaxID=404380 RepID=DXR_CITBB|nr:1-deoxy-D-xylulose-5-phosphate reductoisomerase [Citrifermentans bemidjiense]B5EHV5.1 RecName: Full=1-deoxy-D-xylulose 5-phosphate reductoisomerase; Short=DXP reductoisomerase; AltName: Full=1-deoxyxylulose-5-phosphate reductoisomerase; AltName: Full=2-C-methyl-D-erythritol 4-phosphate synthase [Citrifermentans bemidjiense Bem]ACH39754.1 1-deoxy-D-xylulose-5-phosphate reductoisomerase [Citrifermentans bemidjiense Bem]